MNSAFHFSSCFVVRSCDHIQGDVRAEVALIHYGCYACPDCAILHSMLSDLQHQFKSQFQVVFRHFPIPDLTEQALHAAEAAEAAGSQGKFWQMHEQLFAHQDALGDGELVEYAIALQLDIRCFLQEMRQDVHVNRINEDIESGIQLGIEQAPALFLNGQRYKGELNFETLKTAIEQMIRSTMISES